MTSFLHQDPWLRLGVLFLAAVAPIAFPLSQMGVADLHTLAGRFILPSIGLLFLIALFLAVRRNRGTLALLWHGAVAGALATLALEVFRYAGYRLGFMPGQIPELMGVLLLGRFALGPSLASNIAGYAYHDWNGACFGILFAILSDGFLRRRVIPWATAYGIGIGIGFLASPVVSAIGVGFFGRDAGWQFAATVLIAHAAFGIALGALLKMLSSRCPVVPLAVSA